MTWWKLGDAIRLLPLSFTACGMLSQHLMTILNLSLNTKTIKSDKREYCILYNCLNIDIFNPLQTQISDVEDFVI